jgi:hypothetical protein
MTGDWQTWVALAIVGLAAYRLWRYVRYKPTSASGCGTSCGSCPANRSDEKIKTLPLVQLQTRK